MAKPLQVGDTVRLKWWRYRLHCWHAGGYPPAFARRDVLRVVSIDEAMEGEYVVAYVALGSKIDIIPVELLRKV